MAQYGKTELKRRLSDIQRKGITNQQMKDLIDSLWRNPWSHRTSGFKTEGGTDSSISIEIAENNFIFTIEPITDVFVFFHYREQLTSCSKSESESIIFAAEEGLHVIYYDSDEEIGEKILYQKKDPTDNELEEILRYGVTITFLYYDADEQQIIYFGDNRHGSWWNPWMRQVLQIARNSIRESGLEFINIIADADGSEDEHAEFGISAGKCFHNDILFNANQISSPADLPVFYFSDGDLPRIAQGSVHSLVNSGRLCYNCEGVIVEAESDHYVLCHIFFTDCTIHPHISVMGQDQYDTIGNAKININPEITGIREKLPHQHLLHIGTLIFKTSDDFTNTYKSRIVYHENHIYTRWSVSGDGSIITPVQLLNDEEAPGTSKYYGTNKSSVKGFHSFQTAFQESMAFFKEAYLIENTTDAEVTQMSSWTVLSFNELVGNFKAVVVIHDKTTKAIVTLQNTLGFDYTDVLDEASDDNALINDGSITLTLGIDAVTRLLKAVVSGMTGNSKRIHFCFERCVLGTRIIVMEGTFETLFAMDGVIDLLLDLATEAEMSMEMTGTLALLQELLGNFSMDLDMSGALILLLNINTTSEMSLFMDGLIGLLVSTEADFSLSLDASALLSLVLELQGEFPLIFEMDGDLNLLAELSQQADMALGMSGTLLTQLPPPIRLYNWYAITNLKGISLETEFQIASEQDWANLLAYLGGYDVAGGKLKSTTDWNAPNTGATDEVGFAGLPHGKRSATGVFSDLNDKGHFWIKNINE